MFFRRFEDELFFQNKNMRLHIVMSANCFGVFKKRLKYLLRQYNYEFQNNKKIYNYFTSVMFNLNTYFK